jgi:hypothetical protein
LKKQILQSKAKRKHLVRLIFGFGASSLKKAHRKDYSLPHYAKIRRPEETIIIILMHMARKMAESVKRTGP